MRQKSYASSRCPRPGDPDAAPVPNRRCQTAPAGPVQRRLGSGLGCPRHSPIPDEAPSRRRSRVRAHAARRDPSGSAVRSLVPALLNRPLWHCHEPAPPSPRHCEPEPGRLEVPGWGEHLARPPISPASLTSCPGRRHQPPCAGVGLAGVNLTVKDWPGIMMEARDISVCSQSWTL